MIQAKHGVGDGRRRHRGDEPGPPPQSQTVISAAELQQGKGGDSNRTNTEEGGIRKDKGGSE